LPKIVSIRTPSLLQFDGPEEKARPANPPSFQANPKIHYGANQQWYTGILGSWQRLAGCGPTNAASLLWYLARTRPGCAGLAPQPAAEQTREVMISHMKTVWPYVKPGMHGVNRTDLFRDGVLRFAVDRGISLAADTLDVPPETGDRPDSAQAAIFLQNALERDLPIAFLNLNSGKETRLESWHWMTITAFAPETLTGWCYDQGTCREFDLALWLETTLRGGGFVVVYPLEAKEAEGVSPNSSTPTPGSCPVDRQQPPQSRQNTSDKRS